LSSEHYFNSSVQINWLINDLSKVNRSKTPFIIVYSHRPMYSSNKNHGSDKNYRNAFEKIFFKYKVDILLFGHGFFFF
jgi:hypothetical protein